MADHEYKPLINDTSHEDSPPDHPPPSYVADINSGFPPQGPPIPHQAPPLFNTLPPIMNQQQEPPPYESLPNVQRPPIIRANNSVIICQPARARLVVAPSNAPDYHTLSVLLCVLCTLFFGGVCLIFNIPALLFSQAAVKYNSQRDYEAARRSGRAALLCNLLSIVAAILSVIAIPVAVVMINANRHSRYYHIY